MRIRLVTPEQYQEGYWEQIADRKVRMQFELIAETKEGYIVKDPEAKSEPLYGGSMGPCSSCGFPMRGVEPLMCGDCREYGPPKELQDWSRMWAKIAKEEGSKG